jgi:hypothetical protein
VRAVRCLVVWFAALELLWLVLVGTSQSTEVAAGLCAAAVGATLAEILRRRGLLAYRASPGLIARSARLPLLVAFDFALLTWMLVVSVAHRRRVAGTWVRVPFPTGTGARGRWERAFAVATSNGAANGIVVDFDGDEATMHALRPDVFTGTSVL